MMKHYILVDKEPVEVKSLEVWVRFFSSDRHVGNTMVGEYWVSTVFLGLDHAWRSEIPLLFETMIFSHVNDAQGLFECYQDRCSTYEQAVIMHGEAIIEVKKHYLSTSADAVIRAGALAILTIIAIYLVV
jgi:hypothetical protein